jgi:3-carboxy-cis,cis-muconate cycloisomerase
VPNGLLSAPAVESLFDVHAVIERYLEIEVALARAESTLGLVPPEATRMIEAELRADRIDVARYVQGSEHVGFPIVPLLEQIAEFMPDAEGQYVHWGATTQDIMDTALVLQMRDALTYIADRLGSLRRLLAELADQHRSTVMVGRSQLQYGSPITFGLKVATWLSMLQRHSVRLAELEPRLCVVQLGGAVGTLAALGTDGLRVQRELAGQLDLGVASTAWHTTRDSLVEVVSFLANLTASIGKIGYDVVLLAQTDVGELSEGSVDGRGVSSAMPQKRNPVTSQMLMATASALADHAGAMLRTSVQDHERATGLWMREWRITPDAFALSAGALDGAIGLMEGLDVDVDRMRANVESSDLLMSEAVMMALAPTLGRARSHEIVASAVNVASEHGVPFRQALLDDSTITEHLSEDELDEILSPDAYLGMSDALIDRTLAGETPHAPDTVDPRQEQTP